MATLKGKSIRSKDVELRDTFWPDAEDRIWDRNRFDGYTTVPKTMPLLMRALDELSKGKPLGATYFALWCATWDNGFVRLGRTPDLAYASGFTGPRGARGWQERVKLLEAFGFVEIRPTGDQKLGLAFLPNPNVVLLRLWARKRSHKGGPIEPPGLAGLQDATASAFLERAIDISANDVLEEHKARVAAAKGEEAEEAKPSKAKKAAAAKTYRAAEGRAKGPKCWSRSSMPMCFSRWCYATRCCVRPLPAASKSTGRIAFSMR